MINIFFFAHNTSFVVNVSISSFRNSLCTIIPGLSFMSSMAFLLRLLLKICRFKTPFSIMSWLWLSTTSIITSHCPLVLTYALHLILDAAEHTHLIILLLSSLWNRYYYNRSLITTSGFLLSLTVNFTELIFWNMWYVNTSMYSLFFFCTE